MKEISEYKYEQLLKIPEALDILNKRDFQSNKIYIYVGQDNCLYKLNKVNFLPDEELYAWVDFGTSWGLANGKWNIEFAQIEINKKNVYVFNHPIKLAEWLLEFYKYK